MSSASGVVLGKASEQVFDKLPQIASGLNTKLRVAFTMIRMGFAWIDVDEDNRGNRLLEYRRMKKPEKGEFFIDVKCCSSVARHVEMALEALSPQRLDPPDSAKWTCRVALRRPLTSSG